MKRSPFFIVLASILALFSGLQSGCANPQPTTPTTANVATPEPTPDNVAIEAELMKIENDWPRVMKERDGSAVRRVDDDDVYLLSYDGSVATKEVDVKSIEAGGGAADIIEYSDLKVKVLDKDAAVVTGSITIKGAKRSPDQPFDPNGQYRFVDTFARRDGQWKLISSASVKVPAGAATQTPKGSPSGSPLMKASPAAKPSPSVKASPATKPSANRPAPATSPAMNKTP